MSGVRHNQFRVKRAAEYKGQGKRQFTYDEKGGIEFRWSVSHPVYCDLLKEREHSGEGRHARLDASCKSARRVPKLPMCITKSLRARRDEKRRIAAAAVAPGNSGNSHAAPRCIISLDSQEEMRPLVRVFYK